MSRQPLRTYLQTYRRRSGLSQQDVATLLGLDRGTVAHHELGTKAPSFEALIGYAAIYREPLSVLFAGVYHQVDTHISSRAASLLEALEGSTNPRHVRKLDFLASLAARDDFTYIPCPDSSTDGVPSPSIPPPPALPT